MELKNNTFIGFTELSYFYQQYFLVNISSAPEYQGLSLTNDECLKLFQWVPPGLIVNTTSTLMHPINLNILFDNGILFDADQDISHFVPVKLRMGLQSEYMVRVIYEWCKYLAANYNNVWSGDWAFGQKTGFSSLELGLNFGKLTSTLKPILQANMTYSILQQSGYTCNEVVTATEPSISPIKLASFCPSGFSLANLQSLFVFCSDQSTTNYLEHKAKFFGFTEKEMKQMCDKTSKKPMMGFFINTMEAQMASQYNCINQYCSSYQIAALQAANSAITLNPPAGVTQKPTLTITDWLPKDFPIPFEVQYFLNKTNRLGQLAPLTPLQAMTVFNPNALFANLPTIRSMAESRSGNFAYAQKTIPFNDSTLIEPYVNYIVIELFFKGVTYQATMEQILNGFKPPLLELVKYLPPLLGGDPSTDPFVALNQNNTLLVQTRNTGNDNFTKAGTYYATNGVPMVNYLKPMWNGVTVTNQALSPWSEDVPFQGGDNGFTPKSGKNSVEYGYLSDLYRTIPSSYSSTQVKSTGLTTMTYWTQDSAFYDKGQCPDNAKYYQDKYTGAFNYTKAQQAPVFITNLLFNQFNQSVSDQIVFLNSEGQVVQYTDDLRSSIEIEPRSGIPVNLVVNLQTNVDISSDNLFATRSSLMCPLFMLRRTMQLNSTQVHHF